MVKIELTQEELEKIILMMETSSVQMIYAEKAFALLNKLKGAK